MSKTVELRTENAAGLAFDNLNKLAQTCGDELSVKDIRKSKKKLRKLFSDISDIVIALMYDTYIGAFYYACYEIQSLNIQKNKWASYSTPPKPEKSRVDDFIYRKKRFKRTLKGRLDRWMKLYTRKILTALNEAKISKETPKETKVKMRYLLGTNGETGLTYIYSRLLRTESTAISNEAILDAMAAEEERIKRENKRMSAIISDDDAPDLSYYRYNAILDNRTCEECKSLHGKILPVSMAREGENFPPLHPFCRCTVDYVEKLKRPRTSFDRWRETYVDG